MANWIAAGAVKRPGAFKAKAQAAGKSTAEYAREKSSAPGRLGRQARLAETFAKMRKKKGGLKDHLTRLRSAGAFGRKVA